MRHWIVDREGAFLPSWLEAFPQASMLRRDKSLPLPGRDPLIIWFRCRSNELPESILQFPELTDGQFVIMLADEPEESLVASALAHGAAGCCNTYAAPDVLRQVAVVVEHGGLWIGQALLQRLIGGASRVLAAGTGRQRSDDWTIVLSEREAQVARLVSGGASNKEIAHELSITERTVKAHLSAIFEKLGLRDRLQLSLRINGMGL